MGTVKGTAPRMTCPDCKKDVAARRTIRPGEAQQPRTHRCPHGHTCPFPSWFQCQACKPRKKESP